MKVTEFDLLAPVKLGFLAWLGFSGHVSWWVVAVFIVNEFKLPVKVKR